MPLNTPSPLVRLLLVLSATTGMVDAASILGMEKVFTANMTGNIVFAGFAAVGAEGFHAPYYITAIGAFMAGAVVAGRLWRMGGKGRLSRWLVIAAMAESTMLVLAGILALLFEREGGITAGNLPALIALTAGAMGFRNAVVRQLKVPDLSTTVLTLTITGIASDSRLAAGDGTNQRTRIAAVCMIFAGAAAGAALVFAIGLGLTLLLAGMIVLLATLVFARHPQMAELEKG
ncbi:MAG: DUF1275 domain-containing protein [Erythrobacter sp.]|nr:DUF1275 domain-containing protein [Erythrobacter sp.]